MFTVPRCALLMTVAGCMLPAQTTNFRGTWSASDGNRILTGTWTAAIGADRHEATGGWTLLNANNKQIASGTWSARKAEKRWEGAWQARVVSGRVYSGTWTARSPIVSPASLADMFEFALSNAMSGTWRMGRTEGGWSIRAYPKE